ncbi:MAG: lysoplasmalogenase [Caldilineaceae bacterium]
MLIFILTGLAFGTAILHLWGEYHGPQWLIYSAKPLTTTLLLLLAVVAPQPVSGFYQWSIVAGLLFSLVGDIFLMLPSDRFMAGLISFLIAHLWYIAAFASQVHWPLFSWWGVPVIIWGGVIYVLLAPHLGRLRLPVLGYMAAILFMAWLAITLSGQRGETWTEWAASGAVLFVLSDSVLALNRFRKPFGSAQLIVLGSYYLAQWFIALSV